MTQNDMKCHFAAPVHGFWAIRAGQQPRAFQLNGTLVQLYIIADFKHCLLQTVPIRINLMCFLDLLVSFKYKNGRDRHKYKE